MKETLNKNMPSGIYKRKVSKTRRICETCGKEFLIYRSWLKQCKYKAGRFCSHTCFGKSTKGKMQIHKKN